MSTPTLETSLRGRRCVFVTHWFPGHPNPGDGLLRDASLAMLRRFDCDVIAEWTGKHESPPLATLPEDATLVVSGGGNLGGAIYPGDGLVGILAAELFPSHRVVVLPQTYVEPSDGKLVRRISHILADERVTVFLRDRMSIENFRASFDRDALLARDTVDDFLSVSPAGEPRFGLTSIRRHDNEARLFFPGEDWTSWPGEELMPRLAAGRTLLTDRLHPAIVARKLGRKVVLVINSYFKIKAYFDTWWRNDPMVRLIGTQQELDNLVIEFARDLRRP